MEQALFDDLVQSLKEAKAIARGEAPASRHINITKFDAAAYLDNDEAIAEYISVVLEENDPDAFLSALSTVARARGITQLAKDAGLGRESLYKALAPGANPRYQTVLKLTHALGIGLRAVPLPHKAA